jgi:hypothetical protein
MSALVLAALWVLCAPFLGCAGPRVNLWPIYFQETSASPGVPGQLTTRIEIGGPLFVIEKSPGRLYHSLRPIYNYERDDAQGFHRTQYVWPLGLESSRGGDHYVHRFFPFFFYSRMGQASSGREVVRGMILVLAFWGSQPPDGGYFALFPFWGVLKGVIADRFTFTMFPFSSRYEHGQYTRHDLVWPIISWGGTPDGRQQTLRIWPIYVHKRMEGAYDEHYVLWPIIRWGEEQWATRDGPMTRRRWAVNPFAGAQTTLDSRGDVVAWRRDYLGFKHKADLREGREASAWSAVLGLVRSEQSPDKEDFRIFPLYQRTTFYGRGGRETGREWTRRRFLYVLLWLDRDTREPERDKSGTVVAPLYWRTTTLHTGGPYAGRTDSRTSLWPLMTWDREADGSRHFWLPSYAWKDSSEGYKRNIRPLVDLFQHHSSPGGETETRVLWRLYHRKVVPTGRYVSVPLLWTYDGIGDAGAGGRKSWSALLGLIGRQWWEGGSRWRLLHIPL